MAIHILQNFYERALPLYPPQAERFLDKAAPEIYDNVSFRYTFSVPAMIKISRIIENAALANPRVADVHVSFQLLSRIAPQARQYRRLASSARGLWLYYVADSPPGSVADILSATATTVVDTVNTILPEYWFVIAYGPGISMSLLAHETPSLAEDDDRYYEGFYTFEAETAYQILSILHNIFPEKVPAAIRPEKL